MRYFFYIFIYIFLYKKFFFHIRTFFSANNVYFVKNTNIFSKKKKIFFYLVLQQMNNHACECATLKLFLRILQNSPKQKRRSRFSRNIANRKLYVKLFLSRVISCEFRKIFYNNYWVKHL